MQRRRILPLILGILALPSLWAFSLSPSLRGSHLRIIRDAARHTTAQKPGAALASCGARRAVKGLGVCMLDGYSGTVVDKVCVLLNDALFRCETRGMCLDVLVVAQEPAAAYVSTIP